MFNTESCWDYFRKTGQIEAYLTYVEFLRLTSSEFADDMDKLQKEKYGRESLRLDNKGDKLL